MSDPVAVKPPAHFEEDPPRTGREAGTHESDTLLLNIDGYEGPIDILLEMARKQKVDLTQISILQLVRQYLDFIDRARELRLDLAAEYLVMAAWLAYLKSRLLLPGQEEEDEPGGDEMAAALAYQLQRLQVMQDAAEKLYSRPKLHDNVFARGNAEGLSVQIQKSYDASLYDLLSAYGAIQRRVNTSTYKPVEFNLMSTDEAMKRLGNMLGHLPRKNGKSVWATLQSFLPETKDDPLHCRSSLASTLLAGLEMAKQGQVEIMQDGTFRPIYLRQTANNL